MGTNLSIWLTELGFAKDVIGLFALLSIPFNLKILWVPLIDHLSFPWLSAHQRKTWLLFALWGMALSLIAISWVNPTYALWPLVISILLLYLFTGCLYMTGLAYELECLEEETYSIGSAYVLVGYRIGLLAAGAGALYFSCLWEWSYVFRSMAALLFIGSIFILLQPEPYKSKEILKKKKAQLSEYPSLLQWFLYEIIVKPSKLLFQHPQWHTILLILLLFKLGDGMVKSMEGPFYLSLGFSKASLVTASKVWGMASTISGAFLAGFFFKGKDHYRSLVKIGIIHSCSLISYYILSVIGKSLALLYATVAIEHLTGGMAMTIFISFLWKVSDRQHGSIHYCLLWSLFSFKNNILSCLAGFLATYYSWNTFFLIVTLSGLASSLFLWRYLLLYNPQKSGSSLSVN